MRFYDPNGNQTTFDNFISRALRCEREQPTVDVAWQPVADLRPYYTHKTGVAMTYAATIKR